MPTSTTPAVAHATNANGGTPVSETAIVLLAAGASARMGRPKQLLPVAGQSMLRRAASAAVDSGSRPVVVVLGAQADVLRNELSELPIRTVENRAWANGIGTSIRAGFRAVLHGDGAPRAAMILLCDQPGVTADVIRRLLAAHAGSGKPICVSAYHDTFGPPVVVDSRYFEMLTALPDDQGAKALWAGRLDEVHFEPCPEAGFDIDTPGDYQKWMAEA